MGKNGWELSDTREDNIETQGTDISLRIFTISHIPTWAHTRFPSFNFMVFNESLQVVIEPMAR